MNQAQAVVFDLGKVLLDFDYGKAARNLQKHCLLSLTEIQHLIDQSPLLYRYETNLISTDEFFSELKALAGFGGDLAVFTELFGDIFTPVDPMIQLQAEIKARGLPTYLFSNTNPLAVDHIRARYPFFLNFDGYVLSCVHGAMKPAPSIYEEVEQITGLQGSALLYIDDRPENVHAGQLRGWQAILHRSPEETIPEVRARLQHG
jgi:glucose-1-phosphatase